MSDLILKRIAEAIVAGDIPAVEAAGKEAIEARIEPQVILEEGGSRGLDIVGEKFENLELFLPELLAASETMKALNNMIHPLLKAGEGELAKKKANAKVVFGTVYGDLHDMGKNMAATQLSLHGYEVFDLGTNVPVAEFFKAAEQYGAQIIAMSSLMTTSSYYQKDMVDYLKKVQKRDKYYVIVGGGIVTEDWAEEIGADGYGRTAVDAVTLCDLLLDQEPGTGTIHVFQGSTRRHGAEKTYYKELY
ncbi:MAG: cobalamin-dependent protein [Bacillota bacterium]|jgi:methanogenic corrinoid protein MtbC1